MISSILAEAWRTYRSRFFTIAAIVLFVWIPCELLSSYMESFVFYPNTWDKSMRLQRFFDNFFGIISQAGVISLSFNHLVSNRMDFGQGINAGLSAWWRMWWTRFLNCVVLLLMAALATIAAISMIYWLPKIFWQKILLGTCCALGFLALVIGGLCYYFRTIFIETVVVIENESGISAIRRCFELTRGKFWFIVRFACLLVLVMALPFSLIASVSFLPSSDQWIVFASISCFLDVLLAFVAVSFVCAYKRLFDSEMFSPDS